MRLFQLVSAAALFRGVAEALPNRGAQFAKRQVTAIRDEYDFVIVGAGTAGLTVADRVSAAFPNKTVLVIEYGKIERTVGAYDPPEDGPGATRLTISSPPVATFNNRTTNVTVGITVGGTSAVNGQLLDRGSRGDFDAWARLGSPEFDNSTHSWDWEHFGPAFKKSFFLTEPSDEVAEEYGYTWDASYYTGDAIEASFPPFQWPIVAVSQRGYKEVGLESPVTCDDGNKLGICPIPTAQNSETVERSHAGAGHYTRVAGSRPNLDLLVEHKVTRLIIDDNGTAPPAVEFRPAAGGEVQTIRPNLEVILSAGALHNPQILQRSGVAAAEYLESEGIEVAQDLPGVGQNFQDHPAAVFEYYWDQPSPNEAEIAANETLLAEAVAQFRERPARGPFTIAMDNAAIYVALKDITPEWEQIVAKIRAQIEDRTGLDYLPASAAKSVQDGYLTQLEILAQTLENPENAVFETPIGKGPRLGFLHRPLSRGYIVLNSEDHDANPVVNYATGANPIDLDILAAYTGYFRRVFATDAWLEQGAYEIAPGANVTTHEALVEYMKNTALQSLNHPCCTTAMLPRNKGGVVDSSLSVYGIPGLRVADCSIIPTIPAAHLTTTAYAIGEKAAEIIISEWE